MSKHTTVNGLRPRHSGACRNPVTEYLNIWTTAQEQKANGRGKSNNNQSIYGIKKLRELILELAVRGKLVPQNADDDPAGLLLERINFDKASLVKEGKIKKQKVSPEIADDKKPFDLPFGWAWVSLGVISAFENGDRSKNYPNKSVLVSSGIPFINAGNLENGIVRQVNLSFISENRYKMLRSGKIQEGDILYCLRGSLGKSAIVTGFKRGAIASSLVILRFFSPISIDYMRNYFDSPLAYQMIRLYDNGTAQPNLSAANLARFLVPLPPLAEQHRIVAKVDELMTLCDQLEQQQTNSNATHQTLVEILLAALTRPTTGADGTDPNAIEIFFQHFDTLFTTEQSIDQLKQTILQLAVMGKLVPQDPNDEPASTFLQRIAEEKDRLVITGEIKRQKFFPEIGEDEMPFQLPTTWSMERLGVFGIVGTGTTPARDKDAYYSPPEISWVTSGETNSDYITETKEKISKLAVKETNVSVYPVGTLVVAMYGQGKTRGQVTELMIEAGTNQACAAVVLVDDSEAHRKYIKLFFEKAYEELRSHAAGGAQPNLNVGKISKTVIPIPPLAEQQRIVAKVDELVALCDKIKARISDARTTQFQLADTIVGQAAA